MKTAGKLEVLPDQVAAAVAAVEERGAQPAPIQMLQKNVTISGSGRPAVIVVPADLSDSELAELAGWMLTGLRGELAAMRASAPLSRLIVPGRPS